MPLISLPVLSVRCSFDAVFRESRSMTISFAPLFMVRLQPRLPIPAAAERGCGSRSLMRIFLQRIFMQMIDPSSGLVHWLETGAKRLVDGLSNPSFKRYLGQGP